MWDYLLCLHLTLYVLCIAFFRVLTDWCAARLLHRTDLDNNRRDADQVRQDKRKTWGGGGLQIGLQIRCSWALSIVGCYLDQLVCCTWYLAGALGNISIRKLIVAVAVLHSLSSRLLYQHFFYTECIVVESMYVSGNWYVIKEKCQAEWNEKSESFSLYFQVTLRPDLDFCRESCRVYNETYVRAVASIFALLGLLCFNYRTIHVFNMQCQL